MKYRQATVDDIQSIRDLIQLRIDWMNENNLDAWNKFEYLDIFDVSYFTSHIRHFMLMEEDGKLVGVMGVFGYDAYWSGYDNENVYYIHHLATDPKHKGYGKGLMEFIEYRAKRSGIKKLRLDCQYNNKKLLQFYTKLGYKTLYDFVDEGYHGILLEKEI